MTTYIVIALVSLAVGGTGVWIVMRKNPTLASNSAAQEAQTLLDKAKKP